MKAKAKSRITDGHCSCLGKGDIGTTTGPTGEKVRKSSPAIGFYTPVENTLIAVAEILLTHRRNTAIAKIPIIGKFAKKFLNIEPFTQPDLIKFLEWFEQSLFSFCAYAHCEGRSTDHAFPPELVAYVESQTSVWWKQYAGSQEFQAFSTHPNLLALNKLRVLFREIELAFIKWEESDAMILVSIESQTVRDSILLHRSVLNRLSSYFWCAAQRERHRLGVDPKFWGGKMPKFNQPTLLD